MVKPGAGPGHWTNGTSLPNSAKITQYRQYPDRCILA